MSTKPCDGALYPYKPKKRKASPKKKRKADKCKENSNGGGGKTPALRQLLQKLRVALVKTINYEKLHQSTCIYVEDHRIPENLVLNVPKPDAFEMCENARHQWDSALLDCSRVLLNITCSSYFAEMNASVAACKDLRRAVLDVQVRELGWSRDDAVHELDTWIMAVEKNFNGGQQLGGGGQSKAAATATAGSSLQKTLAPLCHAYEDLLEEVFYQRLINRDSAK